MLIIKIVELCFGELFATDKVIKSLEPLGRKAEIQWGQVSTDIVDMRFEPQQLLSITEGEGKGGAEDGGEGRGEGRGEGGGGGGGGG